MVNVFAGPGQVPAIGLTMMVEVMEVLVKFVAVKEAIFPIPVPAKPIELLLLVQL